MRRLKAATFCVLLSLALGAFTQAQGPAGPSLAAAVDALAAAAYKPDAPGAAVVVVRDGKVVHRKGYGMANLELGVPMRPEFVFRLGSVTKQFTAAAILMLEEQGKLSVSDAITKYLPDYPTGGRTITIEHLLTHTSGIKSYTNMPAWRPLLARDFTVAGLVDFFKNEPMEFEPGERWAYNNSGYVLLGAIIEKVSGVKYADFVQRHIFDALGMTHACYGEHARVIPLRIPGYAPQGATFVNAQYLSMTQPYAAGALLANVDDLVLWDAAITQGKLLRPESWARAFVDYRLKGGKPAGYGYGWSLTAYEGHPVREHGGGIPGFSTFVVRIPDARVFVAVLSNNVGSNPSLLARKMAALAVDKPIPVPTAVAVDPVILARYAGRYEGESGNTLTLAVQGGQLVLQGDGGARRLLASSETELFQVDGISRYTIQKNAAGDVTGLVVTGWSPPATFRRVVQKPPAERATVAVDSVESTTRTPASTSWRRVTGLVLDQNGRQLNAPKVK